MAGLHLTRTDENTAEIDALAAALAADGGGRVGIDGMFSDLPGRLRRTFAPHPRLLGLKVSQAWTWEAHDRRDPEWWPQGITTSARTGFDARHGYDVLATSWYAKSDAGSRISIVDLRRKRYGHVLLVVPTLVDGVAGMTPLKVHAGGIVWAGEHLHVAATSRGFFSFRMDDLMRVSAGSVLETFGHRYVLPVRFTHQGHADDKADRLRFSFFTVDRSGDRPSLVVGEYGAPSKSKRIARFALDPDAALPVDAVEGRFAPEVDDRGMARMQGLSVVEGRYFVTSSRGTTVPGSVFVGTPGAFREHRFATPIGPEDLVWWPETDALWSVSEHPRRRWVYAMDRASFG